MAYLTTLTNSQNQPNVGKYTSRMDAMGMDMNGTFLHGSCPWIAYVFG